MKPSIEFRSVGLVCALGLAAVAGCAATVPRELVDARQAFQHAAGSTGAGLVPDELHKAKVALERAEMAFAQEPEAQSTRDVAYVAGRKAQLVEALGNIAMAERDKQAAVQGQLAAQEEVTNKVRGDLRTAEQRAADEQRARQQGVVALQRTQAQLDAERAAAERDRDALAKTTDQLSASEDARREAEHKADDAMRELSKLMIVKEEGRGTVITLSGSVLFASAQWTLLPGAESRLDQVATALSSRKEHIAIEGHTDNHGADGYNLELSQKRAETVRDYLVSRGIPSERVRAVGYGKSRPVADNHSAEGRANNRRVEIVLERMHVSR